MTNSPRILAGTLRWVARMWGIASGLLLLAFALGGREHLRFTAGEATAFLLFPVGVVAGFAIAWWRELAGGLVTIGCFSLLYAWLFAQSGRWPGPYFILFAAPGFLHVASAIANAVGRRRSPMSTYRPPASLSAVVRRTRTP